MTGQARLSRPEFIAMIAMNFAMVAFSIDAMLSALPEIGAELSPEASNRAQLVLTSFVLGMGLGTLVVGPISDSFGRKPVIAFGLGLYLAGAILAALAPSLDVLLAARLLQGLGVSAPRIVPLAIVRDLYAGRPMAQILSYAMVVFTLVPALAPAVGALIIAGFGWRAIFYGFILFALFTSSWLLLRQAETLPRPSRHPFRPAEMLRLSGECISQRRFVTSVFAQSLGFGILFSSLSSAQQIFDITYGRGVSFPLWYALIALVGGSASLLNARLVMRFGMRRMIAAGFLGQALISGGVLAWSIAGLAPFALFVFWSASVFFMSGLVIGNLLALALEPLGEIAGLASSLMSGIATVAAVGIAVPIGLAFDGTTIPLAMGICLLSLLGALAIRAT